MSKALKALIESQPELMTEHRKFVVRVMVELQRERERNAAK